MGEILVADQIRGAVASKNHDEVLRLLSTRPLEAWFGLPGPEFFSVLSGLPQEAREANFFISMLSHVAHTPLDASGDMFDADGLGPEAANLADVMAVQELDSGVEQLAWSKTVFESLTCRARGQIRRASELGKQYKKPVGVASLFDASGGLECFIAVQAGNTQMLAGDFAGAIARFTSAQLLPTPPELRFLHRDAYVKSALIHALLGDQYIAKALLKRAEGVERTNSWVEGSLDVCVTLTQLALNRGVPTRRELSEIDAIPMHDLGEMWPFYVITLYRIYFAAGLDEEVLARLQLLEQVEFPRIIGDGIPGSVFAMCIASSAAVKGQIALAESRLHEADQTMPVTQLTTAVVALRAGRPDDVLRIVDELKQCTQSLRQTEIWCGSLEVGALLALGDEERAALVVRKMHDEMGMFGEGELLVRDAKLRNFIATHLHQFASDQGADSGVDLPVLTSRESEILALLADNVKRDDIAMLLFVSVNTVKSHQRNLFKKLGVTSREAAVSEGSRLGLIQPLRTV